MTVGVRRNGRKLSRVSTLEELLCEDFLLLSRIKGLEVVDDADLVTPFAVFAVYFLVLFDRTLLSDLIMEYLFVLHEVFNMAVVMLI